MAYGLLWMTSVLAMRGLLADFQPDIVKLDMHLVRDIHSKGPRQTIIKAILAVCRDLGLDVVAEGVESEAEFSWLARRGITLFQGYLFGKPALGCLPGAQFPSAASTYPGPVREA